MVKIKRTENQHFQPDELNGICTVKRDDESNEDVIKRFRKKFSKSGLLKEFREKMFYEKPSDKKRRKKIEAERERKREEEKQLRLQEKRKRIKRKKQKERERQNDKSSSRQNRGSTNEKERY